jgi:hypothetical protein
MDQFPKMLYRMPGTEPIHGGMYATLIVATKDEMHAAIDDGWHETTPEAKDAYAESMNGSTAAPAPAPASAAPTRAELEQKATELGISFAPRTSDKKLAEAIAEKLSAA